MERMNTRLLEPTHRSELTARRTANLTALAGPEAGLHPRSVEVLPTPKKIEEMMTDRGIEMAAIVGDMKIAATEGITTAETTTDEIIIKMAAIEGHMAEGMIETEAARGKTTEETTEVEATKGKMTGGKTN